MPAGMTYTPLATTKLTSSSDTVTFSSIPSGYTDLVLVSQAKGTGSSPIYVRINSDTGTNYSDTEVFGYLGAAYSTRSTGNSYLFLNVTGSSLNGTWGSGITNFNNYSNTTTYKTMLTRFNSAAEATALVGLWRSTAAINSLTLYTTSSTFLDGSTFTLYGILAA